MSDGTPMLYFLDPETLEQINRMMVFDGHDPVWGLNELEYVDGLVMPTSGDRPHRPDRAGVGKVVGWIDMTGF